jgi:hypothetical protein
MRILITALLLGAWVIPAASQQSHGQSGWVNYHNDRYGLSLRYPSDLFVTQRSSAAGDGDLFATANGRARLLVGAFENTDHHSPKSYQSYIARNSYPGLHADYAPVGGSWAVLSGTRGETMIYEKVMFSCGGQVINSFALMYPVSERSLYDPVVEAIEDSFRPGAKGCGEHASNY